MSASIEELRAAVKRADDEYARSRRRASEALYLLRSECDLAQMRLHAALDDAGEYWTAHFTDDGVKRAQRFYTLEDAAYFWQTGGDHWWVDKITEGPDGVEVPETEIHKAIGWDYEEKQS